ncbi:MAG TPA: glycoside hydrolase family 127 protein, partial [Anaerolineaceae bacterium]|nr:glycoside hydrolase family 127 protein [Anaerolineaceae bacterium]
MMHGPGLKAVQITGGFWKERLKLNTEAALRHQWRQLEASGCIQNFRLAARQVEGFREGMFFADSDAYKWLDAAARTLTHSNDAWLRQQVDDFIALLEAAQESDGYLYTYNQLHFPEQRWQNLQLEHEFYCLGHLIEAGVSHFTATGAMRLLNIAQKAANLLVRTFMDAGPLQTDGHEEIEIALLRLYQTVGEKQYLELARRLLEQRGKIGGYAWHFMQQSLRT